MLLKIIKKIILKMILMGILIWRKEKKNFVNGSNRENNVLD